jgi:hypothetical protein
MSIKDVELRFVSRGVPAPEFGEHVGKMVRVLQWRKLMQRQWSETWVHEGSEFPKSGIADEWTEWADVPLVDG